MREIFTYKYLDCECLPNNPSCRHCTTKPGQFRCVECFGQPLLCYSCCLTAHSSLPFHSIEKWTGEFFKKTSLNAEGFILHLGHRGLCCPENVASAAEPEVAEDWGCDTADKVLLKQWEPRDARMLVIIDISRVHQLVVSWCCCQDAPDHCTQLFEYSLFPASTSQPSTAFTFAVLEYFHVDAVECKTSASNFFNKLRRLTDFSNPQSVPVSKTYMTCDIQLMCPRINIMNQ